MNNDYNGDKKLVFTINDVYFNFPFVPQPSLSLDQSGLAVETDLNDLNMERNLFGSSFGTKSCLKAK